MRKSHGENELPMRASIPELEFSAPQFVGLLAASVRKTILILMQCVPKTQTMKSISVYALTPICMSSVLGSLAGCDRRTNSEAATAPDQQLAPAPLLLAITADRTGITMAHSTRLDFELPRRDFYVLLSNVSGGAPEPVEDWNSWAIKRFRSS
jgi:hypothetical protein